MKIDVVIPTHRNRKGLERLLASIANADLNAVAKICVVMNPADDESESDLKKKFRAFANLDFIQTPRVGVNHARNLGIKNCGSEIILFLDDDEIIEDKNLFTSHLATHVRETSLVALGGIYKLTSPAGLWSRAYNQVQTKWLLSGEILDGTNYHLLGGHISIKRDIFNTFLFDESIKFGGAETELFSRFMARKVDCRLDSSLAILHSHNMSFGKLLKKAYLQGRTHRHFGFQDINQLQRKIGANPATSNLTETCAILLYAAFFNAGRNRAKMLVPQVTYFRYFLLGIKNQVLWLGLRIEFLTKKIEKPRAPDA